MSANPFLPPEIYQNVSSSQKFFSDNLQLVLNGYPLAQEYL
jgi:hypothetical protein